MGLDKKAYIVGKNYTKAYVDETLDGVGAIKGKNCEIKKIEDKDDGSHIVTFSWTTNSGREETTTMTVYDGKGKEIIAINIINNHLIFTYEDGTTYDAGIIHAEVPIASKSTLGGIKVGKGLTIASDGTLSATGMEVDIDDELSITSGNPVQNKVITTELEKKISVGIEDEKLLFI